MSTRSALYIQNDDATWNEIPCHYDGTPSMMLPALAAHDPQRILDAGDLRSITVESIDPFDIGRLPRIRRKLTMPMWADYAYVLTATGWQVARTDAELAYHSDAQMELI